MRKTSYYAVGTLVIAIVIGAFASDKPAWSCSAKLGASGVLYDQKSRPGLKTLIDTNGTLISATVAIDPIKLIVNLRSIGSYSFTYSPNITNIRLSIGHHLVYEGPPISKFDGQGVLEIQPQWVGSEISVEMHDKCSPSSILKGLFR